MSFDFSESVDLIYTGRHQEVPPETFQTIGKAMLFSEQGKTVEQIGKELNLEPQQVREMLIRAHGHELTEQQQEKIRRNR